MEPIFNTTGSVKAIETLFFEEAEVTKMRGGRPSFATFGHLSVLYVPHFHRFILQINDWRYPILRRLSITNAGNGSYTLPGPNGSTFDLRITKPGTGLLSNLDNILEGTRKLEASPEDKLVRMKKQAETGPKEVITETIKQVIKKVGNKVATMKTGTKYLTSTSKRSNVKDLKNRDFRQEAHAKLNKNFFESSDKLTMEFTRRRRDNLNQGQTKSFDDLMKTSESHAAVFHIPQVELEEAILNNKDIVEAPKTEMKSTGRERLPEVQGHVEKTPITEGMTHYQG